MDAMFSSMEPVIARVSSTVELSHRLSSIVSDDVVDAALNSILGVRSNLGKSYL